MDFLALYITAGLMHIAVRPLRLALAAAVGAVYSLAVLLLDSSFSSPPVQFITFLLGLVCAYIMAAISFSAVWKEALKTGITFTAVSVGLGGCITAIGGMLESFSTTMGTPPLPVSPTASPATFIIIAVISGAVSLLYGKLRNRSVAKRKLTVSLRAFGSQCELTLLCDSGNLLRDPMSQKPVLVVAASVLCELLPPEILQCAASPLSYTRLPKELAYRLRLIPVNSVTGSCILLGFVPDMLVANGRRLDAVVAVDAVNNSFGECDGILPQILLTV